MNHACTSLAQVLELVESDTCLYLAKVFELLESDTCLYLAQVFESVERHQQSENELQERVRRLSEEVSKQKQLFSVSEQEHKEHLNKLQSQKAKMEVRCAKLF